MAYVIGERPKWWRIILDFNEYGSIEASISTLATGLTTTFQKSCIAKKIYDALPIATEAIVIWDLEEEKEEKSRKQTRVPVELLIKLPSRFRQKILRRDHTVKPGDVVYRPHIPAISIFVKDFEIYEPIEKIGHVRRAYMPNLYDIVEKTKNLASIYVEIRKAEIEVPEEE